MDVISNEEVPKITGKNIFSRSLICEIAEPFRLKFSEIIHQRQ